MNTTQAASDLMDYALMRERAEAAEARANSSDEMIETLVNEKAQLEAERDDYGRKYSALMQATQSREAELRAKLITAQAKADLWDKLQHDIDAGVYILEMPRGDE